ncbi:HhH-GDP family DNA glycosylase [Pseudomonas phoenicis]|uniref:DNA methylase n=1 Tax=unclassified Pseudomonas TaxID=196821 RepID=UPI0039A07808
MQPITAKNLALDLDNLCGPDTFLWLVAAFLIGKRIRAPVAVAAYRQLVQRQGLDSPAKFVACSHATLVRSLGEAGYRRYDESTARRLQALARKFAAQMPHQHADLLAGKTTQADFERWLLEFEGIGPKTVEIFMREAQGLFALSKGN